MQFWEYYEKTLLLQGCSIWSLAVDKDKRILVSMNIAVCAIDSV